MEHEIEELTRLLDSKKEERARLQTELEEVDVKIHNVRKKYERQLRRGNDRRAEHVLMRSEIQEDENRALRSKQEKETDISSQMGVLVRSQQIASTIITDVEIAQLFVGHISSEALNTANDSLLVVLSCSGSDLARRSRSSSSSDGNSLAAAQTAWSNAQQEHGLLEVELQDLETEARALSERLPKLEAEKKSHAAGKRFKEAAAAASAMKEATARISSIEIDTATLLERLTASAEAVNKCAENVQAALEEQRQGTSHIFVYPTVLTTQVYRSASRKQDLYSAYSASDTGSAYPPTHSNSSVGFYKLVTHIICYSHLHRKSSLGDK